MVQREHLCGYSLVVISAQMEKVTEGTDREDMFCGCFV